MRIGIFTECYKPILNGVVNSIVGFRDGLTKLGHDVYIFCPKYKDYRPEDDKVIYCDSLPLPGKSGYHFILPLSKGIKNIAKTMDVIHVQHPFVMGDRAASVAKEFDIPLVFTNHTQYEQYAHYIPVSEKIVTHTIESYILGFSKKVDLIVAPAAGIVKILRGYGIKTDIEIVPNGIDIKKFTKHVPDKTINNICDQYHIDRNKKILIFTGRIAEEKNLTFLLKSFAKIHKINTQTHLLLVGGGPQIRQYQQLISTLHLDKDVTITDYVPYANIPNYLALGYMYVTASKSEVHPLTILEGLAAHLPMVIVDAPGTSDIVSNNIEGLIAKDNIDDFVAKTINILNDRKLYDKLRANTTDTAKKYSYLATSKLMLKTYQKAINIHNNKGVK